MADAFIIDDGFEFESLLQDTFLTCVRSSTSFHEIEIDNSAAANALPGEWQQCNRIQFKVGHESDDAGAQIVVRGGDLCLWMANIPGGAITRAALETGSKKIGASPGFIKDGALPILLLQSIFEPPTEAVKNTPQWSFVHCPHDLEMSYGDADDGMDATAAPCCACGRATPKAFFECRSCSNPFVVCIDCAPEEHSIVA